MKKHAKLLSLFIALIMLFALALPAMAYETDGLFDNVTPDLNPGPPRDEWQISRIYHWVVRGETLTDIANAYGTTTDDIIGNNWNYFVDLWSRNVTRWEDNWDVYGMILENGVRLWIYDLLTVSHYVRRGDTLNDLAGEFNPAGGTLSLYDDLGLEIFRMKTTVDAVRHENGDWFRNLELLNITHAADVPLMESNIIFARYSGLVINGFRSRWDAWSISGSPLYISVPVTVGYCIYNGVTQGAYPHPRISMGVSQDAYAVTLFNRTDACKTSLSEDRVTASSAEGFWLPLIREQRIYGNTIPTENPVATYNLGWTKDLAEKDFYLTHMGVDWFRNLKMDTAGGWYLYGTDPAPLPDFGEWAPWEGFWPQF